MENITLQLPTPIAMGLALEKGWQPTVDDTTQPIDGDVYPQIPNPETFQAFLSVYCSGFIFEHVLQAGRDKILTEFKSQLDAIESQVNNGAFDELLKTGQFEAIRTAVKSAL